MSRIKNNFKWDINHLQTNMRERWKTAMDEDKMPYAFAMHPETLYSIIMSDEYEKGGYQFRSDSLFMFKVIGDINMHIGEWNLLIKE